jgi:hypothetical protein
LTSSISSPIDPSPSSPTGASRDAGIDRQPTELLEATDRQPDRVRHLLDGRFATQPLHEGALDPPDLVHRLDQVHRDADRARLVGDRPADHLPDPPGRVGRELVAALVVELLDRAHETQVALLDHVGEQQAAADVPLGDRDHQPQVGLDHGLPGAPSQALDAAQAGALLRAELGRRVEHPRRGDTRVDALRQVDLGLRVEQVDPADLVEVEPHSVHAGGGVQRGARGVGGRQSSSTIATPSRRSTRARAATVPPSPSMVARAAASSRVVTKPRS